MTLRSDDFCVGNSNAMGCRRSFNRVEGELFGFMSFLMAHSVSHFDDSGENKMNRWKGKQLENVLQFNFCWSTILTGRSCEVLDRGGKHTLSNTLYYGKRRNQSIQVFQFQSPWITSTSHLKEWNIFLVWRIPDWTLTEPQNHFRKPVTKGIAWRTFIHSFIHSL